MARTRILSAGWPHVMPWKEKLFIMRKLRVVLAAICRFSRNPKPLSCSLCEITDCCSTLVQEHLSAKVAASQAYHSQLHLAQTLHYYRKS